MLMLNTIHTHSHTIIVNSMVLNTSRRWLEVAARDELPQRVLLHPQALAVLDLLGWGDSMMYQGFNAIQRP